MPAKKTTEESNPEESSGPTLEALTARAVALEGSGLRLTPSWRETKLQGNLEPEDLAKLDSELTQLEQQFRGAGGESPQSA
ncbi:MAG: hypothetical protein HC857_00565 [Synechococcales cyanobacterium RU_4_20]|nr:hypothetical protein [Synechococcales cyanobacterium RU_4_20]